MRATFRALLVPAAACGLLAGSARADGPHPDEPFARARDAEIARRVRAAIQDLTPDHRAVILLRELEGLSYAEISQVLECPKGTVMSRLHYARRQLQRRLRELL